MCSLNFGGSCGYIFQPSVNMLLRSTLLALSFLPLLAIQDTISSVKQSSVALAKQNVIVTCECKCNASTNGKEVRITLRRKLSKSEEVADVCSGSFNLFYEPFNQSEGSRNCIGIPSAKKMTFYLWNHTVDPSDVAIYYCFMQIMSPAPYLEYTYNGTVIHVTEELPCRSPEPPEPTSWLMYALVGVLVCYATAVSLALLCCSRKRKSRTTQQSDYMNMTPRRLNNKHYQPYTPPRADMLR
ncbi:T-cell-specific surface glycoprotein CD28 [Ambystoma mexicanum]|uniref:T-cell-specific surface glycoprotein CD28 n=1 Tax=Ambystoma mexicanum TaxID=8296 RepID=UPI0037E92C50